MKTTPLEEFKRISAVPRRSDHNEKIVAYCLERGKELGLETYYDEKNMNVLIRKPAVPGKEDHPGIVLQGHLDMVEQTNPGIEHDWDNEGLELIIDGDTVTANGTTLGADDGVAPAISFALLSDESLENPPLEVFLTTNEEVGMDSVKDADLSYLKGDYLFNLDSGEEGVFVTGCCGGRLLKVWVPEEREEMDGSAYTLTVSGLNGGHSGIEIGTERANAIKVLGQVFYDLSKKYDFRITDVTAEGKDNAISKEASADLVVLDEHYATDMAALVKESEEKLRQTFRLTDPDLSISVKTRGNCTVKADTNSLTKERTTALWNLMMLLPFGVLHHDQALDGNIETSCNLGLIEKGEKGYGINVSIRSSVTERGQEVEDTVHSIAALCKAEVEAAGKAYPAWLPDPSSPLIPLFKEMFKKMYGKDASVGPVHAGLECGYILSNSNLKAAIATGPEIRDEHTTKESLSISSLNRTYDFMKALIENV